MAKKPDIDQALQDLDLSGWTALEDATAADLAAIYAASAARGIAQVGAKAGEETLDQVNNDAVDFANARAAELVTEISDSTRDLIRANVTEAVEQGWSNDKLAAELQDSYAFSAERSEVIARTETAFADVQGNLAGWKESGVVEGFNVILGSEHDIDDECDEYAEGGPYELGDDTPPFHPNCVCDIVPVTTKETEE